MLTRKQALTLLRQDNEVLSIALDKARSIRWLDGKTLTYQIEVDLWLFWVFVHPDNTLSIVA